MPAVAGWALAAVAVQCCTSSLQVCNRLAPGDACCQGHLPQAPLLKLLCILQLPSDPPQNVPAGSWVPNAALGEEFMDGVSAHMVWMGCGGMWPHP